MGDSPQSEVFTNLSYERLSELHCWDERASHEAREDKIRVV